jgi:hypothetical protein
MSDSPVFEWACATLERASNLSRLQARGTMRIVLKLAGLDSKSLRAVQLRVVVERLMPHELKTLGVGNA